MRWEAVAHHITGRQRVWSLIMATRMFWEGVERVHSTLVRPAALFHGVQCLLYHGVQCLLYCWLTDWVLLWLLPSWLCHPTWLPTPPPPPPALRVSLQVLS